MGYFGIPFRNGVPIGLGSVASFGAQQFDPSSLFIGGTVGTFYDPSDPTTLFTTSTGTTPCAVPGSGSQVLMGLMLDKSQGAPGALGAELVTNGDFSQGSTGWTPGAGWSIAGGVAIGAAANTNLIQSNVAPSPVGKTYRVTLTIVTRTTGSIFPQIGGSVVTLSAAGTYTFYLTPTLSDSTFYIPGNNFTGTITNISIRQIPGNHAIAFNDTTARPELSARVNLLTYSEQFDNAVWTKTNATVTANSTVAPDGNATADTLVETAASGAHSIAQAFTPAVGTYTTSVYVKASTRTWVFVQNDFGSNNTYQFYNVETGVLGTQSGLGGTATITLVGNGWYRCTLTTTTTTTTAGAVRIYVTTGDGVVSYAGNGTSGIFIWGADLRPANIGSAVPSYQRIADQYTYDSNGFPSYLRFDGVDDSMYTPASINFSGTDKMSVFAGVRKLSDAAVGMVAELSTSISTGAFDMQAPSSTGGDNYRYRAGGTTIVNPGIASGYAAPVSNVLTAQNDIGAPSISLRVNAVQVVSNTSSQGTGNFGTYPLFIGSRNNAGFRFNGHLYSLIIAGAQLQSGSITATEQYVAGKAGITI